MAVKVKFSNQGFLSGKSRGFRRNGGMAADQRLNEFPRDGRFVSTHWSVVMMAGQSHLPQAADALEKLCRAYWYPL